MPDTRTRRFAPSSAAAAIAITGVAAMLLSGCTGAPAPSPTPIPSMAADPIFASDEEALAAAEAAYTAYIAVSQEIAEDGGARPDRILAVAAPDYAGEVIADFQKMSAQGLKVIGANTLDTTSLVEYVDSDGTARVSIYGCVGVGTTRIVDDSGTDLTPERDERVPLILDFVSGAVYGSLILAGSDLWSGDDFC